MAEQVLDESLARALQSNIVNEVADSSNRALLTGPLPGVYGDYDYGLAGAQGENGHYTDAGKLPQHPTFSNESAYSNAQTPGGSWVESDGKWLYTPTANQLQQKGYEASLARYFNNEKGKGIDEVVYPAPYITPEKFKGK